MKKNVNALLIAAFLILLISPSFAEEQIDMQALMQETQKMSQAADQIKLVWWLPEQFWQASLAQDPTVTAEQKEQLLSTLRPYVMLAVVDGQMGPFGGVNYKSEPDIRSSIKITDAQGNTYSPLADSEVNADAINLLQGMKPVIVNMLGPLGQNMHFYLFPSKNKDGQLFADPTKEGMLKVTLADNEFVYRLPLGCVLPPKYDPKTGEKFPGNYNYNPFTGTELTTTKPAGK